MSSQLSLNRLRQPEYTGENRCIPCTSVNIAIGLAIGGIVGYFWVPAGVGVFAISLIVIYLRGYLVPGTPAFTKQYLPEPVLRLFDKVETGAGVASTPSPMGAAMRNGQSQSERQLDGPEMLLLEANTVEPCEHRDDLCLTDEFRAAWHDRMEAIDSSNGQKTRTTEEQAEKEETDEKTALNKIVETNEELHIDSNNPENDVIAYTDSKHVGHWESRAAFLADISAAVELSKQYLDWNELVVEERSQVVSGLRIFLEECPTCTGAIEMGEEIVESCCRSREVVAVSCTDCGSRILEINSPETS